MPCASRSQRQGNLQGSRGETRSGSALGFKHLGWEPRPKGAEPFKGVEKAYRIRVGAFRIVYQVDDEHRTVHVIKIGDRKEVYRRR